MVFLPYLGVMAVIFAAFYVWRIYVSYLEGSHRISRAFLGALMDLKEKIRCYLDSPRAWSEVYRDPLLEECSFLPRVRDGEDLLAAYGGAREHVTLPSGIDEVLVACFSRLGDGYLDTELEAIGTSIDKLRSEVDRLGDELTKKRKVAGALIGACASGIVILVI